MSERSLRATPEGRDLVQALHLNLLMSDQLPVRLTLRGEPQAAAGFG